MIMQKYLIVICALVVLFMAGCTVPQQAQDVTQLLEKDDVVVKPIAIKNMVEALPLENFLSYETTELEDISYVWQDGQYINAIKKTYMNNQQEITITITDTLGLPSFTLGWNNRKEINSSSKLVYHTIMQGQPAWIEYSKEFEEGYGEILIDNRILVTVEGNNPTTAKDIEFFLNAVNIRYIDMLEDRTD